MKKLILLLILSGCATTIPQENRTRLYDKPVDDAKKAAIVFLESNGYSIDADNIEMGLIKGEKPYDNMTTFLVGSGRFELGFLITQSSNGDASVSISPKAFSKNVFGVESQATFSGAQIQELVDDAFAQYTRIIGGGDMGSVASIKADAASSLKELPCSDSGADEVRVIVFGDTPMYQKASTGSAIVMQLSAGVRVHTYNTNGSFTQVCNEHTKAWIKSDKLGRISSKQ